MSDLSVIRGDTTFLDVAVVDALGAQVNVTGSTFWFTVKRSSQHTDAEALIAKTSAAGITITDAAHGIGYVQIDPADWALVPYGVETLAWDLQEKTPGGVVTTLGHGAFIVTPDITRTTT